MPNPIYLNPFGQYFTDVSGVWREIPDLPEEYKQTATKLNDVEYNKIYRGTSGGDMPWQMITKRWQDEAARNAPPPPPPPPPSPNAFRPRAEGENMTSYLQAKQAHEMQTTGSSTISFGTPAAQPPAQPAPIAPQAPVSPVAPAPAVQQPQTPQLTSTNPTDYYKVNTGNIGADGKPIYDIYSKTTGKLTGEQGMPLFKAGLNVDHIPEQSTPSPQPSQPAQPAETTQPTTQQPTSAGKPATEPPIASSEVSATQPYVRYLGSPDVFETSTGRYVTEAEGKADPSIFSKVQDIPTPRPGVQTEADFKNLERTNLQLQQSGATTTSQDFQDNPLKAFQDTYSQIWNNLGLNSVKEQIETTLKAMKEVDFEMIDKIAEINDNPWLSEADRSRQVVKLQGKYEQKNKANTENLKLLQGLFETGQKEAQFISSNALEVYYKERTFDENEKLKAMDLAEKMSVAMNKKTFRDLVGSDGKMHTYIVNESGEKLADLGVSEMPKAGEKRDTKTITLGGKTVLIDSNTGEVIKEYTTEPTPAEKKDIEEKVKNAGTSLQIANDKLEDINSLIKHKGLSLTVGASKLSRGLLAGTPFDLFTGDREDFAGKIHRLVSGLSLDSLIEAKARGATFGALSDNELRMLASAASAIDDWEIKKDGEGTGMWDVSEKSFKEELQRIKTLTEKAVRDSEKVIVPEDEFDQYYNSAFDALNYFE